MSSPIISNFFASDEVKITEKESKLVSNESQGPVALLQESWPPSTLLLAGEKEISSLNDDCSMD